MYDNWTEVRQQMAQALASERAQRQARRQRTFWQSLRQWWQAIVDFAQGQGRLQPASHAARPRQ